MNSDRSAARCSAVPRKLARAKSSALALMVACGFVALVPGAARADTASEIKQLRQLIEAQQKQIESQQQKLDQLSNTQAQTTAQVNQAEQAAVAASNTAKEAATTASGLSITNSKVKVTLGGFTEAASIDRSRSENTDIASNFNSGIPLPNTSAYHTSEFRGTARQSRLSILAEGQVSDDMKLSGYFESDFIGTGVTSNSNESNSYVPRIRVAYATLDLNNYGLHFLGGQSWSLLTVNKIGITPRTEDSPMVIDAQYVPGFSWARQWTLRVVQDIDENQHLGFAVEAPQTTFYSSPNGTLATGLVNGSSGVSPLNTLQTYSNDIAPDVLAKYAVDTGFGHFEAYGVARFFHNQIGAAGAAGGTNKIVLGGGGGIGMIVPVVPQMLDFKFSTLVGKGIGRYGSAQFSDVTEDPNGNIVPLSEIEALVGLIGHPDPSLDIYGYAGAEKVQRADFVGSNGLGYGYGSELYNNTGCYTIGGTCTANTSAVVQGTIGGWWKFYKGSYGTMQVGLQDSYTERYTYAALGGSPHVGENIFLTSFRYYPF